MPEKIIDTIIIDDNPAFREFLLGLLSRFDFIKVIAEMDTAEKVLKEMEKIKPHLVIVDIRLPGMTGLELARILKDSFDEIEVILITLYDDIQYRSEAERLDFAYIPKSSLVEELPVLLEKLWKKEIEEDYR